MSLKTDSVNYGSMSELVMELIKDGEGQTRHGEMWELGIFLSMYGLILAGVKPCPRAVSAKLLMK